MVQTTLWTVTDPTSDSIAQQASALSSLAASAPDELSDDAKASTVSLCRDLLQHVSNSDRASISSILSTITSVAGQAAADAAALLIQTQRRLLHMAGALSLQDYHHHMRRLAVSTQTAQSLQDGTNAAIADVAKAVLDGVTAGESVIGIPVRIYCIGNDLSFLVGHAVSYLLCAMRCRVIT